VPYLVSHSELPGSIGHPRLLRCGATLDHPALGR
jgi:hypothetical protein